jgi:hypothetical protein
MLGHLSSVQKRFCCATCTVRMAGGVNPVCCCVVSKVNPPRVKNPCCCCVGGGSPPPLFLQELLLRWGVDPPGLCVASCCVGPEWKQNKTKLERTRLRCCCVGGLTPPSRCCCVGGLTPPSSDACCCCGGLTPPLPQISYCCCVLRGNLYEGIYDVVSRTWFPPHLQDVATGTGKVPG